jgi:hypothetical protein
MSAGVDPTGTSRTEPSGSEILNIFVISRAPYLRRRTASSWCATLPIASMP